MKVSNIRTLYTIENESATLALRGEAQLTEDRISSFNGQFYSLDEERRHMGDFYFSENENGETVNKSVSSVPSEITSDVCELLDSTVKAIHEYTAPEAVDGE